MTMPLKPASAPASASAAARRARAPPARRPRRGHAATRCALASPREAGAELNEVSSTITQPKSQGASQAMLRATGLSDADLKKAQVGIASVWYEGNPCNMHLLELSEHCKRGVEESGLIGFRFNTVGVSDGMSMGTPGMCYSLQSREIIADSIETVMGAQWYDANVSVPGCSPTRSLARSPTHSRTHALAHSQVRREHQHPRVRQEHARDGDGDGAREPAERDGVRRHHPGTRI